MKVLLLCASGNRTGYTYRMCQDFAAAVRASGHGMEILDLSSFDIRDCIGCGACRKGAGCTLRDDMPVLLKALEDADLLVMATPIRFNGPSSFLKRFIDRLNILWHCPGNHPAHACGLICGGSPEPNFGHARSEMVSAAKGIGSHWAGELCFSNTDAGEYDPGRVRAFAEEVLKTIGQ